MNLNRFNSHRALRLLKNEKWNLNCDVWNFVSFGSSMQPILMGEIKTHFDFESVDFFHFDANRFVIHPKKII